MFNLAAFGGARGFANPWLLSALIALPVLWWLLRAIPPSPKLEVFAGVRLLLGLEGERPSAPGVPSGAAVLQADKMTQSASSLRPATSLAVNRPSSSSVPTSGGVRTRAGSARPLSSPATTAWVANARTL